MSRYPKPGTILCVCIALGTLLRCGVAQAGLWEHPGARDPMVGDGPFTGAHSEVPPGWSMSRTDPTGALGPARRDPSVSLDPAAGRIRESYVQGGVEMAPPMVSDLDSYSTLLTQRSYRKLWKDSSRETRSISRAGQKRTSGLLHYELPPMFKVPRQLRGLLGDGAPNIDVSGSETITLSGISDWTVRPQNSVVSEHKRPSAFPSLEMKQDLQVNLTGSIGDKIKVDVDQSSNVQTNLDNKVKLRYEGDEDTRRKPAYHNGTAWTWTFPVFCEALARAWDFSPQAIAAAKAYLGSMERLMNEGCLGQIPEILDGDAPHQSRGCDAQAWGVTEALRVWTLLDRRS